MCVVIPRDFNVVRNVARKVVRNVALNVVWGLEHSVQGRFSELRDAAATASMDRNNNRKSRLHGTRMSETLARAQEDYIFRPDLQLETLSMELLSTRSGMSTKLNVQSCHLRHASGDVCELTKSIVASSSLMPVCLAEQRRSCART